MKTLVLHNILRSDAAEKCGKDSVDDEYLRMVNSMAVPLLYVLVAFLIGKTDEEKQSLQGAEVSQRIWPRDGSIVGSRIRGCTLECVRGT